MSQPISNKITSAISAIVEGRITPEIVLFLAVGQDDLELARSILTLYPASLAYNGPHGNNALHWARSLAMVELLCADRRFDLVNSTNDKNHTPLAAICLEEHKFPRLQLRRAIRVMLQAGADPRVHITAPTAFGSRGSLIYYMAEKNFVPEFLELHAADGLADDVCSNGFNVEATKLLRIFISRKNPVAVAALCNSELDKARRPDPNNRTGAEVGSMPLFLAVTFRASEIIPILVSASANTELYTDRDRRTPLVYAVSRHDRKCVDALVAAGARVPDALQLARRTPYPDLRGRLGDTARFTNLCAAAGNGNMEQIRVFLARPESKETIYSALICAINSGYLACVRLLAEAYGEPIRADTLVFSAAEKEPEITRWLSCRVAASARGDALAEAAWRAVHSDRPDNLRVLLQEGADANMRGGSSSAVPILAFAASNWNPGCMIELIAAGASLLPVYPQDYVDDISTLPMHAEIHEMAAQLDAERLPRSMIKEYFDC